MVVGILRGEGIGREVTDAALRVLAAVEERFGYEFECREGGLIGLEGDMRGGGYLSDEVAEWSRGIFAEGAAILAGAGGGRFVYDIRRRFDLYCKVNPIKPMRVLDDVSRVRMEAGRELDLLVLRENLNGLYQGEAKECDDAGERVLEYTMSHVESEVRRFLETSVALARGRKGRLAVVSKEGGLPEVARFWREIAAEAVSGSGVECRFIDIDYACYLMVQEPWQFDVVASSNCFGDILSDMGGLLLGGRGMTFGASYSAAGAAVYQTNHGSAQDLKGTGRANPLGHLLSMAMMLRESYGLGDAAAAVEAAADRVLGRGIRTEDIAAAGSVVVSIEEMAEYLAEEIRGLECEVST